MYKDTLICWSLLAAGAAVLIVYILEKVRGFTVRGVLLKSIVSLLFIAVAVCAAWGAGNAHALPASSGGGLNFGMSPLSAFVIFGLVCGLCGDIWLDLKFVFPQEDVKFTYAGFFIFGIGHIAYMAGLLTQFWGSGKIPVTGASGSGSGPSPLFIVLPLLLGALMSGANLLLEKPMKFEFGRMRRVVAAYGVLLFADLLLAGSLALLYSWQNQTLNLFFAGQVLFTLSDLVLSGTYFGKGHDRPIDIWLNYLFYYGAQFTIAYSLIFVK